MGERTGGSRAATAGWAFAACLLSLLCLVLPASAQASNGRRHREAALIDRRAAPIDRGALVDRRKAKAHHRYARLYRRRALTHRRGGPVDGEGAVGQEGPWIDQLPSAEFTHPSEKTVSQADKPVRGGVEVTPPSEAEDPVTIPPLEAEKPSPALYWGATIGDHLTGTQAPWDMSAVSQFAGLAGKPLSLVNVFVPFANCSPTPCSFYKFAPGMMESIREYGAIPVYSWSSQSIPSSLE
jgi:hypothetical protein